MTDVAIESVEVSRLDALVALAESTFRATFGSYNTEEDQLAFIAEHLSAGVFERKLADPSHEIAAAFRGDSMIAYLVLVHDSPNEAVTAAKPIELSKLYVDSGHHRRGLGRHLMEHILDRARRAGHDVLWLSVWENNERAKAFYRTFGFRKVGTWEYAVGRKIDIDEIWVLDLG